MQRIALLLLIGRVMTESHRFAVVGRVPAADSVGTYALSGPLLPSIVGACCLRAGSVKIQCLWRRNVLALDRLAMVESWERRWQMETLS